MSAWTCLESALRLFDDNYRVYQLLFKHNQETIPHSFCGKTIVDSAIRNRIAYFTEKAESLFSLSIYFVVFCPAMSARRSLTNSILEFPANPRTSFADLSAHFFSKASVHLNSREITRAEAALRQK